MYKGGSFSLMGDGEKSSLDWERKREKGKTEHRCKERERRKKT
jgi:hypothetical protein